MRGESFIGCFKIVHTMLTATIDQQRRAYLLCISADINIFIVQYFFRGVLAYLLKPHADTGTLELTEIRPSDRTDADLDVRLTLVGEDNYTTGRHCVLIIQYQAGSSTSVLIHYFSLFVLLMYSHGTFCIFILHS